MQNQTMGVIYQILPFIILIGIMYFMLIRPQKKKDKEIASMRAGLKTGDAIVTIGGICGRIVKIKDETVTIQVGAEKVKMEIMKWAVSAVVEKKASSKSESSSKRPKSLKKEDKKADIMDVETETVEKADKKEADAAADSAEKTEEK